MVITSLPCILVNIVIILLKKGLSYWDWDQKMYLKVDVDENGVMDVDSLKQVIEKTKKEGYTPLYINATAGTTVFGSYDPFLEISKVAKEHNIHFHIDGSWGGNVIFTKI